MVPNRCQGKRKGKNEMTSKGGSKHLTLGGGKLPLHNVPSRYTRSFLEGALHLSYLSPTHIPTHQQSPTFLALAEMGYGPVKSSTPGMHSFLLINKSSTPGMHSLSEIIFKKKEKHPAREQEKNEERTKVQTKDHTRKCRMHFFTSDQLCCNNEEEVERPKSLDQLPAATEVKSSGQP